MFGVRRLLVALIAVMTSLLPIAELGLFGYETFVAEEAADDQRDQSFQDLMALQAQIDLHATQASLLPDGPEKADAYQRTEEAIKIWDRAFDAWREGDYESMFFKAQQGRQKLQGDDVVIAQDAPWLQETVQAPAFPWLVLGATILTSAVLWAVLIAGRTRDDPEPRPQP